jgi:hypothetical protein
MDEFGWCGIRDVESGNDPVLDRLDSEWAAAVVHDLNLRRRPPTGFLPAGSSAGSGDAAIHSITPS